MLIFLVNSRAVWSIAATIVQLSEILDVLWSLKFWNQVDFLVIACFDVRYSRWVVGNENTNPKIRQFSCTIETKKRDI